MSLLQCPNEVLLLITRDLPAVSLSALARTNWLFFNLAQESLLRHSCSEKHAILALSLAAAYRDEKAVRYLLKNGQGFSIREEDGSPLYGPLDSVINYVLQKGPNLIVNHNLTYTCATTPHHAIISGNTTLLKTLLSKGANANLKDSLHGWTSLHQAVHSENYSAIETLLENTPLTLNSRSTFGETTLHIAATLRSSRMCQFLLSHNADPTLQDFSGSTPLALSVSWNNIPTIKLLLNHTPNTTANSTAGCDDGNGVINMQDHNGRTPLHLSAIHYTTPEIPHLLLSAGADPSIRTRAGETPLHYAATYTRPELVDLLLRRSPGIAVNSRDNTGSTPLHWASRSGRMGVVKLLKNAGADTGLVGRCGGCVGRSGSSDRVRKKSGGGGIPWG
ncbi:ankyrin repeat-containing domain protein [Tuber brumale]|nr:ankyrin repeat-containing domain protein [Tuber brumale]